MAPVEITDDYYAILEVPQTATLDIIKKSYRRLAVLLHPDKNSNKPDATTSFQCVSLHPQSTTVSEGSCLLLLKAVGGISNNKRPRETTNI